jgi:hypothetical protein
MMPRPLHFVVLAAALAAPAFAATISVDDPRPLAAVIAELSAQSGVAVTYEDPPYEYAGSIADVTRAVRGGASGPGEPALLVPKGGRLSVTVPDSIAKSEAADAVRSVVGRYNQMGGPATFSVVERAGFIHVVPDRARDAGGRMQDVASVLDAKIALRAKPRNGLELLEEFCAAVSAASGVTVEIGMAPYDALAAKSLGGGAVGETARNVLERLIADSGLPLSWRLLYDPGGDAYYLNLPVVE